MHRSRLPAGAAKLTVRATRMGGSSEIANPVAGWEEDLHSTHPPLRDRVAMARALDLPEAAAPSDDRPALVLLERLLQPVASA